MNRNSSVSKMSDYGLDGN